MSAERSRGEVWGITPDRWPAEVTFNRVLDALIRGVDRVILRERRLLWADQIALIERLLAAGMAGGRLLLRVDTHTSLDQASQLGCGLHLADTRWAELPRVPYCSRAVHNAETLRTVGTSIDAVLVSPLFPPRSKSGVVPPLGLSGMRQMATLASVPLIALGGITPNRARACLDAGAAGVAAISAVFGEDPTELDALLRACHIAPPLG